MAGPKNRLLDGAPPGWTGHARKTVGAITKSDVTVYDPPLRCLVVGGAGDVYILLDGDDEADSSKVFPVTCTANQRLTVFAIRQVRSATTATGLIGFT